MSGEKNKIFGLGEYFLVFLISVLALCIRLINIDKPFGLWYDEMLTYVVSSHSFPVGILQECWRFDFHMPLYYMYVHIWMKLFGITDLALRLSSVIWGVLCVPAFFYLGKTYKNKVLGYFLAIVATLSPIMIYYSQEVRFYSMLMFFSAISLIFFLKLLENLERRDFVIWGFASLVILYIYTMGIIFVGIQALILLAHFYLYKKNYFTRLFKYFVLFGFFSIPYLFLLASYLYFSNQVFLDPFSYYPSNNFGTLFILLNDWFSPALSLEGGNIYQQFLQNNVSVLGLIIMIMPTLCFVAGLVSAVRKPDRKLFYLSLIASLFIISEIFLSFFGSFVLLSKYTLITLPIILLIVVNGLLMLKNKPLKKMLIGLILLIYILNSFNYRHTTSFSLRHNGLKPVTVELAKLKPSKNDYILFTNGPYLLGKYLQGTNFVDFDIPAILYLDKSKSEARNVFAKNFIYTTNKQNSLDKFSFYLLDAEPTLELQTFEKSLIERIPSGGRLIIVDSWGSPFINSMRNDILNYQNNKSVQNKRVYKQRIFYFVYAKIYADLNLLIKDDKFLKQIQTINFDKISPCNRPWRIVVYEKRLHV